MNFVGGNQGATIIEFRGSTVVVEPSFDDKGVHSARCKVMERDCVALAILAKDFGLDGGNLVDGWQPGCGWKLRVDNLDGPRLQTELFHLLQDDGVVLM